MKIRRSRLLVCLVFSLKMLRVLRPSSGPPFHFLHSLIVWASVKIPSASLFDLVRHPITKILKMMHVRSIIVPLLLLLLLTTTTISSIWMSVAGASAGDAVAAADATVRYSRFAFLRYFLFFSLRCADMHSSPVALAKWTPWVNGSFSTEIEMPRKYRAHRLWYALCVSRKQLIFSIFSYWLKNKLGFSTSLMFRAFCSWYY